MQHVKTFFMADLQKVLTLELSGARFSRVRLDDGLEPRRLRNAEVAANLASKLVVDFVVPRNGATFARGDM